MEVFGRDPSARITSSSPSRGACTLSVQVLTRATQVARFRVTKKRTTCVFCAAESDVDLSHELLGFFVVPPQKPSARDPGSPVPLAHGSACSSPHASDAGRSLPRHEKTHHVRFLCRGEDLNLTGSVHLADLLLRATHSQNVSQGLQVLPRLQHNNRAMLRMALVCVVPRRGLEPPRDCSHCDLNAARLPIPPPRHGSTIPQNTGSGYEHLVASPPVYGAQ